MSTRGWVYVIVGLVVLACLLAWGLVAGGSERNERRRDDE